MNLVLYLIHNDDTQTTLWKDCMFANQGGWKLLNVQSSSPYKFNQCRVVNVLKSFNLFAFSEFKLKYSQYIKYLNEKPFNFYSILYFTQMLLRV